VNPSPSSDYPFAWLPDGTTVERPEPGPEPSQPLGPPKRSGWRTALEWVGLVLAAVVIAVLIKTFLFQAFYIPSESMVPTLKTNDRVIVNKLSYKLHPVHRGDIIVFKAPPKVDPGIKDLVKRVIGLPGEMISARADGHVYINGTLLREPYLPTGVTTTPPFGPFRIPKDSYWVMGDNRGNSKDSRYFPQHFIPKKDIVGRVFLRVWPLNRIGIL